MNVVTANVQRAIALVAGISAAMVVGACVAVLTSSYWEARGRAPLDKETVAQLQEKVKADATLADELAAEHDRQATAARERRAGNERITSVLIVAAVVFLACMKWFLALRERQPLALSRLTRVRTPPASAAHVSAARARDGVPGGGMSAADEIDLAFVDEIIAREGHGPEAAVPILQAIQAHYRYLPVEALTRVCERAAITPARIAGTSTFYARFRHSPVGRHVVRVCHGTACHVAGARQITEELRRHLEIAPDADTDAQRMFTLDEVACLGCCSLAPVLMVDEHTAGRLTPSSACEALCVVEREQPA